MTIEDVAGKAFSKERFDGLLADAVRGPDGVPGVVAMITDRNGNVYEGSAGERTAGVADPMSTDTVFALFSTAKAITGTAVLQCVEEGLLDLDAPTATYVPEIGELKVLDGFSDQGEPILREPKREITTRMLMLHTAGFGYDFFNESYNRLSQEHGQPSVITGTKGALTTPLLFDPGEKWEYGTSMDWAGQVVESIRGQRLGTVMQERIFEPLEMTDTAFSMTPSMKDRLATIHQREADGTLTPLVGFELPAEPEVHMGGHGLHGTVGDYMKFIRMWLNDGAGSQGRVLSQETVAAAAKNGLEGQHVGLLPGVIPTLSNDAEFFPGVPKGWAYSFMTNEEVAPTGRPVGSLAWAGLANLYYWIDRQSGVGGFWATQILPFADAGSVGGYLDFESAVYR